VFDHEKLDVYRLAIEFVVWVDAGLDETPSKTRINVLGARRWKETDRETPESAEHE
jgi:hypothetical protein